MIRIGKNTFLDKFLKVSLAILIIFTSLHVAREFFIPLTVAALLSFLFLPLVERLIKIGLGEVFSIFICLLIIILFLIIVVFLFYSQLIDFSENFPILEAKATKKFVTTIQFIESKTRITAQKQIQLLGVINKKMLAGDWLQNIFVVTTNLFISLGLIIVYIFCFLFYRSRINSFFLSFNTVNDERAVEVLTKIKKLSSHYFIGMASVMLILGTMHSIGLLLLKIPHAIFLGYLAALFILIPIVGTIIGSLIPILVALLMKDSIWYAIGVAGIFSFNLFMESNVFTPIIIGSRMKINPMAVIIAIVIGGFIWGLPGMVLFIPLTGMLKIISDNIQSLLPLRILLSDNKI